METVCLSTSFAKLQQCLDLDIGPALAPTNKPSPHILISENPSTWVLETHPRLLDGVTKHCIDNPTKAVFLNQRNTLRIYTSVFDAEKVKDTYLIQIFAKEKAPSSKGYGAHQEVYQFHLFSILCRSYFEITSKRRSLLNIIRMRELENQWMELKSTYVKKVTAIPQPQFDIAQNLRYPHWIFEPGLFCWR
jgi:hypothetical protein